MDNTEKYKALRGRYPVFDYEAYHYEVCDEGLKVWFDFRMGDVVFRPEALVERREFLRFGAENCGAWLDRMVFDIGMVELVSYWKCACPPVVRVLCGILSQTEVAFWKKLYWNGLGEFYYTNGIAETPDAFMRISSQWSVVGSQCAAQNGDNPLTTGYCPLPTAHCPLSTHYLVPIGGGKDSVVTLELLRRAGKRVRPLIMNPRGATVECARVAGFPMEEVLVIRRKIDPTLLELNAQGYLNGHTPFSAMLAFYTRLASLLSGIPNVALSNESSANESTVAGSYVNHQYSKSLEFENDFRNYISSQLSVVSSQCATHNGGSPLPTAHCPLPTNNYFSFLRPLSELQIAMLFSRFTQYHDVFRSCNVGSKTDVWCGHCAKCLFAYIILSPFIAPERLNAIFGKPMLDDLSLRHEFEQLTGVAETKPFECVGTVDEVNTALSMALERWYAGRRPALAADYTPVARERWVGLSALLPEGNLTEDERNILEECIGKNN